VLVPWTPSASRAGILGGPCPAFPYAWVSSEIGGIAIWRTSALCDAGGFPRDFDAGLDLWDALLGAMARGWVAATLPLVAAQDGRARSRLHEALATTARVRMWPWMLARTAGHLETYAADLAVLLSTRIDPFHPVAAAAAARAGVPEQVERRLASAVSLARRVLAHPRYVAGRLAALARARVARPERASDLRGRGAP
jgi:hypothetical protein